MAQERAAAKRVKVPRNGAYGLDAPYLLPVPVLIIAASIVQAAVTASPWALISGAIMLACVVSGLYSSRRGKFVAWAKVLEQLDLRGDERVLDLGCGRGAVLLMAAEHLTTGRAIGVDIWNRLDQSGNAADATRRNAVLEGVADRVELVTADMQALPFEDAGFDVVVSSLAIHNVKSRAGREKAIEEAVRVLRPGGRLVVADIFATRLYVARLRKLGLEGVTRRNLGWRMWWGGPWMPTHLVTAAKPA